MKNLIIGGTGTVGSEVVRELLARSENVRIVTRSADKQKNLPKGADAVVADLTDPTTLTKAFEGIDNVFMLNPVSPTETHEGLMGVLAAKAADVKRFVYLSVQDADRAPLVPHFASKVPIETALRSSGLAWTVLRPNNFYQNDVWFKDAVLKYGVYPQPIGDLGLNRVDVRDIAEVAAIALTKGGLDGKTLNLVGPKPLNGASTAEIWSSVVGKKINYGGNDLEAWAKMASTMMPAWMVLDFKVMYAMFQQRGLLAADEDIKRLTQIMGHAPRGYDAYVAELAKTWK